MAAHWRLRLSAQAETDLLKIVGWTVEQFGVSQARLYRRTILATIGELLGDPARIGVRDRSDIVPGLKTMHVARRGRRGRHFILFRVAVDQGVVEVLRILHDSMDFARHVPARDDDS